MPRPQHARRSVRPYFAFAGAASVAAASAIVPLATASASPGASVLLPEPAAPALGDTHVQHVTLARLPVSHVRHAARTDRYLIRPGDTLTAISWRVCGTPADYLALAVNNRIPDPDRIYAGNVIREACHAAASALSRYHPQAPAASQPAAVSDPPAPGQPQQAVVTSAGGTLSCAGLEQLWKAAGGNPADAFMAAEIAMAESGGQQYAHSPTDDLGYWQINTSNGALATYDAYGNARSAVILSGNGTNWSPWTTYTSGAYAGRC